MRNKLLLLAMLLPAAAFAVESRTYLVLRAQYFPDDKYIDKPSPLEYKKFIDTGKKDISAAGGQPFRITTYDLNFNGKYALWGVTYNDADELGHINGLEQAGKIVLLSSTSLVDVYTPQRGHQPDIFYKKLADLPTDFYNVEPSSGT